MTVDIDWEESRGRTSVWLLGFAPHKPFSFSVVVSEHPQSIIDSSSAKKIGKKTGLNSSVSYHRPKVNQPPLTASARLLDIGIDACAHCDRVTGRGFDQF